MLLKLFIKRLKRSIAIFKFSREYAPGVEVSNDNTETAGVTAYFDASKSNPIYGASSHVTPVNTAVYAYIYAGKVNKDGGNPNLASCSSGQYYYADGTCSSSFNSSIMPPSRWPSAW